MINIISKNTSRCSSSKREMSHPTAIKKWAILSLPILLFASSIYAQKIEWVSTTENALWKKENIQTSKQAFNATSITINPTLKEQTMMGFGGCFNEAGWEALKLIPTSEQDKVFAELFSAKGANFCYNRFPIGASDYANDFYSFDETPGDFQMRNFSISRDLDGLIPYIKKAQQYNPSMAFFASPWCPPTWMKTNENYASLSDAKFNTLKPELQSVTKTTGFKMLRGYLDAYALYFSKFLDAYHEQGIDISDLHVQNEVVAEQIFPSCIWEPQDLSLFIADYLGPRFEKEHRKVHIWFSTLNVGDPNYMRTAMANQKAAKYIYGMGFQWDGKNAIATIHQEYPQLHIIQSENECGGGENNWKSALHLWGLMKHYLNSGAEAYTYWNFILKSPGVSRWNWVQNSMVVINETSRKVTYTPEFYVMKHLSHYVQKGAAKISLSGYDDALAFQNPDGRIILMIANQENTRHDFLLNVNGKKLKISLKANSFNTLKI
jgi:glucosylceramidase